MHSSLGRVGSAVARPVFSLSLLAFSILSGCGSGSTLVPRPQTPAASPSAARANGSVEFSITWPNPNKASSARRRDYLSNATASIAIAVNGGTPQPADNPFLSPGASKAGTQTTTVDVVAPAGSDTVVISDYDARGGTGHLLARTSFVTTVAQDQANVITATLDGNLASIDYSAVPNRFLTDAKPTYTVTGAQSQTFDLVPRDASGNVIIAPGALPALTLAAADPKAIAVAPGSTTNEFSVTALEPDVSVTMNATGTSLDGVPVAATFTVKTLAAIYVVSGGTDCGNGPPSTVTAYSENGTQIALPSGAFPNIVACAQGIMYVPPSAGAPGQLYVGYGSMARFPPPAPCPLQQNSDAPPIPFDLSGTPVTVPLCTFPYWSQPGFSRFAPTVGTRGEFLMTGAEGGQDFHEYDPLGNFLYGAESDSGGSPFSRLLFTTSVAVDTIADANQGNFYFSNSCIGSSGGNPCSLDWYTPDGTLKGAINNSNFLLNSIALDTHNSELYVTGTSSGIGMVGAYTEALAAVTLPPFVGLRSADDIAFDAGNNTLYVSDHTANAVKAFAENGLPSNNVPTMGAFPNLFSPQGIVVVP